MNPKKSVDRLQRWLRRPILRGSLAALSIYTAATLIMTYPVARHLNTVLAGFPARDGWQYTWWLWFAKRLVANGRGLADLYLLNHPVGLYHPYQWSLAYLSLVALPLETLFSPVTTFNLMVLASFVLSGLSAYHLCYALSKSHWAAVVGGAIFAFAPNRLGHAMAGWLPQMTVYVYPWYALALIWTLRRPTIRRSIILGILAGIGASVYVMHIAYFLVPLTVVIVGAALIRLGRDFFKERRVRYLGVALAIALVIAVPPLLPLTMGRFQEELSYLSTTGVVGHSTDLLAFFTPSPYHPVLARLGLIPSYAERIFTDREALRAASAYVGILPLALAIWGLLRGKPRPWMWGALACGAALLSLGPILVLGGKAVQYTADGFRAHILLPYAIIRQIPFLDWGRTPGRLNAVAMLGLGVLAAYGVSDLLERRRTSGRSRALVGGAAVIVILFEFLPLWPFPTADATTPPAIRYIASRPGDGAVLHIPLRRRRVNHRALFFQTALDRPIVGGEVLRMVPETPPWWRTIAGLVEGDSTPDIVPRPNESQQRAWLRHFNIDWVLLHLLDPSDEARYRAPLERLLGSAVLEDETLAAFSVGEDAGRPEERRLYTLGASGWYRVEQDAGTWRRWMTQDAQLYIYSTDEHRGALRFNIDSHLNFPLLEVHGDGQLLDSFVVGDRTTYMTKPIILNQGMNIFRFHAPGGCREMLNDPHCWSEALLEPPDDQQPPCDGATTCRTFIFDHVSFVPADEFAAGEATDVNFGRQMRLRGWAVEDTTLEAGGLLDVTLTWEAMVKPSERHVVFIHLLSPEGKLVAQHDDAPVGSAVSASAWPAGGTLSYPMSIQVPGDLREGKYRLVVGVYLWPELERLPVIEQNATASTHAFEVAEIEIVP